MSVDTEKESLYTPEQCRQLLRKEITAVDKAKMSIRSVIATIAIIAMVCVTAMTLTYNAYSRAQEHQDTERLRISQLQQKVIQERAVTDVKLKVLQQDVTEVKQDIKAAIEAQQKIITIMMEIRQDRKDLEQQIDRNLEAVTRQIKDLHR